MSDIVDIDRVEKLTDDFYNGGFDISKLMRSIYTSDWFYEEKNIGAKIMSPVELLIRYKSLIALNFKEDKAQLNLQKVLGQPPCFLPPRPRFSRGCLASLSVGITSTNCCG